MSASEVKGPDRSSTPTQQHADDSNARLEEWKKSHVSGGALETTTVSVARMADGTKVVNEYAIVRALGQGTCGKVKLCSSRITLAEYAMKIVDKAALRKRRLGSHLTLDDVHREIAIMRVMDHQNVIRLHEVIDDPECNKLYILMHYAHGGAVLRSAGKVACDPLPVDKVRSYFRDVLRGLMYVHQQGVIHRDIKPENLLLMQDGRVVICDFGVAHVFEGEDDTVYKTVGSPAFYSPEVFYGSSYHGKPVDVWALGITLFYLVVGKPPFYHDRMGAMAKAIQNDPVIYPENMDSTLRNLLEQLLDKNPDTRIKLDSCLTHPWVQEQIS